MTKITIERETLELAIAALTYHQTQTRPIESTRITLETLRALLAAQPPTVDGHLKCGHHQSLAINSAETGEFLYCDLCDAKSRCRDAEAMEAELRAALAAQPADIVNPISQQEPVAWRHSKTGRLYDSEEEVPLADGDEWAEPLYLAAPPQPVRLSDYDIWKNDVIMAANADIGLPMADLMKLVLAIEAAMAAKQTGENDGM